MDPFINMLIIKNKYHLNKDGIDIIKKWCYTSHLHPWRDDEETLATRIDQVYVK